MLEIFAVHGINTPAPARLTYGSEWQSLLAKGGVTASVTAGQWNSQDPASDVANVVGDAAFRSKAIDTIAADLETWATATVGKKRILLAHSMGQVLSLAACRLASTRNVTIDFDAVTMGGPLENPLWAVAFDAVGLREPAPNPRTLHFWNRDDPICAAAGQISDVGWMDSIRIAIAGSPAPWNPFDLTEHDYRLYLQNGLLLSIVGSYGT